MRPNFLPPSNATAWAWSRVSLDEELSISPEPWSRCVCSRNTQPIYICASLNKHYIPENGNITLTGFRLLMKLIRPEHIETESGAPNGRSGALIASPLKVSGSFHMVPQLSWKLPRYFLMFHGSCGSLTRSSGSFHGSGGRFHASGRSFLDFERSFYRFHGSFHLDGIFYERY